jgi:p-cumate 2,3-dioxygenase beta subunit
MSSTISRIEAEEFLVNEAEILDDWRLPEWPKLFSREARYEVTGPGSDDPKTDSPDTHLFLVADRIDRIEGRATRLMKPTAHAEYPHSKTRHLVSNFRVRPGDKEGETKVRANFAVFRTKEDNQTVYMGEYHYTLVRENGEIKILAKRCILDLNSLANQGRLTIIL